MVIAVLLAETDREHEVENAIHLSHLVEALLVLGSPNRQMNARKSLVLVGHYYFFDGQA